MSLNLLKSLFVKSARLQIAIEQEKRQHLPDTFRLLRLKKLRLIVSDKIYALARKYHVRERPRSWSTSDLRA